MQDDVTEAVALLPCPFCGGEAMLYTWDFDKSEPQSFHVACTGCEGGFTPSYSRAEAIAAWNTRAAMPSRDAWQDIATAPRDREFLALNHDGEVWLARYIDNRLAFRMRYRHEPRRFEIVRADGEELLREDKQFAQENESWRNDWCYWTRLYEFTPTQWYPAPPEARKHLTEQGEG